MTLRDYASRITLGKAVTGSDNPLPLPLWNSYSLGKELWTSIKSAHGLSSLVWLLSCIPVGFCCQDLPVPTHTPLDEPGTSFPALLWGPPEPEELEHWGHIGTVSVPQDQSSYPQTFLRCLPDVFVKAASIAMLFSCCRLKKHHLFCPHWAENIAYLFHSHFAYMPGLLKGLLALSHYFPVDSF